jgi:formylglycine-generating enzyme required for sulfatase activity
MADTTSRSADAPDKRQPFEPEMVPIPAGPFLMGSDPDKDAHARENERPQHSLYLPDYALARLPVTNAQYAAFLKATGHTPPAHWKILFWRKRWPPRGRHDHPVVNVSWYDGLAYCAWLSEATGKPFRLPNEAEWEKAARGTDGRIYPWGDVWSAGCCHISEGTEKKDTAPVGVYPAGASPYGLLGMVGNVWEWTRSLWGRNLRKAHFLYPYDPGDGREDPHAPTDMRRVLRGVSFLNDRTVARCASRYRYSPGNFYSSVGFRVALAPASTASQTHVNRNTQDKREGAVRDATSHH